MEVAFHESLDRGREFSDQEQARCISRSFGQDRLQVRQRLATFLYQVVHPGEQNCLDTVQSQGGAGQQLSKHRRWSGHRTGWVGPQEARGAGCSGCGEDVDPLHAEMCEGAGNERDRTLHVRCDYEKLSCGVEWVYPLDGRSEHLGEGMPVARSGVDHMLASGDSRPGGCSLTQRRATDLCKSDLPLGRCAIARAAVDR